MRKRELISRIKRHESVCSKKLKAAFFVTEVVELAKGVLAVRDTDHEYTLYFDKFKVKIRKESPFEDGGLMIKSIPDDTGFVINNMARSWLAIFETARTNLETKTGVEIQWYKDPVKVTY